MDAVCIGMGDKYEVQGGGQGTREGTGGGSRGGRGRERSRTTKAKNPGEGEWRMFGAASRM